MKNWKKRGECMTLAEYVKEQTGKSMEEFMDVYKPYHILGFDEVAKILVHAKRERKTIRIVGDYDADGIGSVLILASLFKALSIPFTITLPKRISEGYGISEKIVERIEEDIVITIDNGIAAIEPIKKLKEKGKTVIVLDHHIAGEELPPADIIIDPSAFPETADFAYYCGAGLAYKLSEYVLGENHPLLNTLSGYAAISTIGDSVLLAEDNRRIVLKGMLALKTGYCTDGLKKMMELCGIDIYSTSQDIAFNLVPCVNAPGRLFDDGSIKAVKTMWASGEKAEALANELVEINNTRKEIVNKTMESLDLEQMKNDPVGVSIVYLPEIPEGIAGLIAGKLSEGVGKPSVVVVKSENGILKASCRSKTDNVHLKHCLDACSDILLKYGGHPKAAAFSIEEEKYPLLRERLEPVFPKFERDDASYYDFEISPSEISYMSDMLDSVQPFGEGIPEPIIRIRNVRIGDHFGNKVSFIGAEKNHVKLAFKTFNAIGFNMAEEFKQTVPEDTEFYDMIGYLQKNHYNGKTYFQIRLIDCQKSDRREEK